MTKRAASMAAIDLALEGDSSMPVPSDQNKTAFPELAPGVQTVTQDPIAPPPPLQGLREEEDLSERQRLIDTALREREVEQARNTDAFYKSAGVTSNAARGIVRGTSLRLERLPAPGSVLLPLLVLLVLFFLLLPVNGHTRFMWLWLTITGNAYIAPSSDATDTSVPGPAQDIPLLPFLNTSSFKTIGTFAEQPI